ncbi:unnamed protein product [Musa acuminata subsp. malaccensis]|uniref:(wild Malaysian banana) hypothetical protein n=1 Tax=Musa acuminata subsp. malaccensis TaxID=214687 RepID=A0A8D6ZTN4_MUSAM|nr:unnamed protein product [Musa acuminata subsp. malaccensis]
MGWAAVAAEGLGVRGCCSLPVASAKSSLGRPTIVASKTTRPRRRVNGSPPRKQQPSVAEVQKAIGVVDDPFRSPDGASSSSSSSSPFLGFLQDESPAERKLRKAAEWVVDSTEAQAQSGTPVTLPLIPSLASFQFAKYCRRRKRAKNPVASMSKYLTSVAFAPPGCIWSCKVAI